MNNKVSPTLYMNKLRAENVPLDSTYTQQTSKDLRVHTVWVSTFEKVLTASMARSGWDLA